MHPPIPTEEFEQAELLAVEKEAIGLFVSAHPLKPLREALRARVDCPLSALADRRDKDLVTVGGIITEAKRIRTRNGDQMMFATLDDLEGAVEMLVFGKALAEHEAALAVDEVVLVKGRVDHKEAGKTCLVVQTVETFSPSAGGDRARPHAGRRGRPDRHVRSPSRCICASTRPACPASAIEDCKQLIEDFPGPAEVVLEIDTSTGTRRLRLGEAYRVQHTPTLRAELEHALAPVAPRLRRQRPDAARVEDGPFTSCGPRRPARAASSPARFPRALGPSRFSPGVSSTQGSFCRPGADRNAMQPSLAELARADVGVAVAV